MATICGTALVSMLRHCGGRSSMLTHAFVQKQTRLRLPHPAPQTTFQTWQPTSAADRSTPVAPRGRTSGDTTLLHHSQQSTDGIALPPRALPGAMHTGHAGAMQGPCRGHAGAMHTGTHKAGAVQTYLHEHVSPCPHRVSTAHTPLAPQPRSPITHSPIALHSQALLECRCEDMY